MGPVLWKKTFYLHKAIKNCKFLKNLTKKMIQMIKKNNIKDLQPVKMTKCKKNKRIYKHI